VKAPLFDGGIPFFVAERWRIRRKLLSAARRRLLRTGDSCSTRLRVAITASTFTRPNPFGLVYGYPGEDGGGGGIRGP